MTNMSSFTQTWTCAECRVQWTAPSLPPGCPPFVGVPVGWHALNNLPLCSDACLWARVLFCAKDDK